MRLRRASTPILALAIAACAETVNQEPAPAELVFAAFNPATATLPQPNDLALQAAPTLTAPALQAQRQLLEAFIAAGGFPSDQEVAITIPITAQRLGGEGTYQPAPAPAVDLATVTDRTVVVLQLNAAGNAVASLPYDASTTAGSCTTSGCTPGVLTLRKKADANGRRWPAGARIAVAVRGGPAGVRTASGVALAADQPIALITPGKDLSVTENQPLGGLPPALAQQLEGLRALYDNALPWCNLGGAWAPPLPPAPPTACGAPPASSAFDAVADHFPVAEIAAIQTFGVAPSAGTVVLIDAGSGVAPLPIDLLRTGPNGTIAANPAFGPAAAGLATLDGFSTTAMMLAQTSGAIDAATVNGGNVFVYRLGGAGPTRILDVVEAGTIIAGGGSAVPAFVAEPPQIVQACAIPSGRCSTAIGLQPAVPVSLAGTPLAALGTFYLPPLQENASYAVVVTRRVRDVAGQGLARPTIGKILLDLTAPVYAGGQSLLAGVDAATAAALQRMKDELAPVMASLPAGTAAADVAVAWTFKTQSITGTSLQLSALPFSVEAGARAAVFTPAAVSQVVPPAGVPTAGVAAFYDVAFRSVDAIDKTTGALRPTLASDVANPAVLPTLLVDLRALVAVPALAAPGPAKLVIFGHGLGGSRETMLATASSLASRGFIAAAIDFPLHGLRNWCSANSDCVDGAADGVCTPFPGAAGQGDAVPPGSCTTGVTRVFDASGANIPSRHFISANFFRTRDAFRQNLLDQSALGLALARPPAPLAPQPLDNPFTAALAALPVPVVPDPSAVYFEGVSLGAIFGTSVAATSPRVTRAAFSVGGGTLVDVFTNSPSFQPQSDALFATIIPGFSRAKITPGPEFDPAIAASYLRTLGVAKWILDPGESVNYAGHLVTAPLPNLLADPTGAVPQAPKEVFAQVALGDTVVPNPFNLLLDSLSAGATVVYTDDSPAGGPAPHGMIGSIPEVQADAAAFLFDLTTPSSPRAVPVP